MRHGLPDGLDAGRESSRPPVTVSQRSAGSSASRKLLFSMRLLKWKGTPEKPVAFGCFERAHDLLWKREILEPDGRQRRPDDGSGAASRRGHNAAAPPSDRSRHGVTSRSPMTAPTTVQRLRWVRQTPLGISGAARRVDDRGKIVLPPACSPPAMQWFTRPERLVLEGTKEGALWKNGAHSLQIGLVCENHFRRAFLENGAPAHPGPFSD